MTKLSKEKKILLVGALGAFALAAVGSASAYYVGAQQAEGNGQHNRVMAQRNHSTPENGEHPQANHVAGLHAKAHAHHGVQHQLRDEKGSRMVKGQRIHLQQHDADCDGDHEGERERGHIGKREG